MCVCLCFSVCGFMRGIPFIWLCVCGVFGCCCMCVCCVVSSLCVVCHMVSGMCAVVVYCFVLVCVGLVRVVSEFSTPFLFMSECMVCRVVLCGGLCCCVGVWRCVVLCVVRRCGVT